MREIYPVEEGLVRIRPIGAVRSSVREEQTGGLIAVRAEVEVDPDLEPLLEGVEEFSHLWVLFWMAGVREHSVARRPQGRDDVPVVGMLASR